MTIARTALDTIGSTPIVQLQRLPGDDAARVLVKLESFNPTGSYKDRMARAIIEGAEARGDLTPGMTVVELTGGSTGSSLALVCAVKGHPLKIVTSDALAGGVGIAGMIVGVARGLRERYPSRRAAPGNAGRTRWIVMKGREVCGELGG